jgi:hypothetical protein
MALTEEQIENLKHGDPLVIHGTFEEVLKDGDICIKSSMRLGSLVNENDLKCAHPSVVSIDKPKHDPCRPFREGDRVQARKIHGNLPQCRYNGNVGIKEGDIGTIARYNERNCYWVDFHKGMNWCIDAAYLELITPVEELEPYSVGESSHTWYVYKDDDVVVAFNKEKYPNAKEAAEAERDRLNEEWRKERNHD